MTLLCSNITDFMEALAPKHMAEEWDNVGLLVGSSEKPVKRVLLALDVTWEVVGEAIDLNAELIISHHPVIFKGMKSILEDTPKGKLASRLIRHDISVYSAHTNLDVAVGGVNDVLAQRLGLISAVSFKDYGSPDARGYQHGLGKVGYLKEEMALSDFAELVKESLGAKYVKTGGNAATSVKRVAAFCGSFDDDLDALFKSGADVLVTGDVRYHTAMDILQMGKCVIDAGHFNTEKVILPVIKDKLALEFPELEIYCSVVETDPFTAY